MEDGDANTRAEQLSAVYHNATVKLPWSRPRLTVSQVEADTTIKNLAAGETPTFVTVGPTS